MAKHFILSFDDGTVWDKPMVELLNRYGIPCTFNLNSGLETFVWYYEDRIPICRQHLADTLAQYCGHEVASHTCTHPWLNSLTPPQLRQEVEADCHKLRAIFGLEQIGFAVPFTACSEREIGILKRHVRYIRLSQESGSFALPPDPYHIPIHSLYNAPDVRQRIKAFARNTLEDSLFVLAGHSYELEALDHWGYFEELLRFIKTFDFRFMTTMDFVNTHYPK